MNPITVLGIIAGCAAFIAISAMYLIYLCTPAKRWRGAVLRLRADALRRRHQNEVECRECHDQCARELQAAGDRHFRALLRRLETDELKS